MRKPPILLTAVLLFAAAPASAGLHSVTATLNVALGNWPAAAFSGSAAAASSAGLGGAATLPAGAISGVFSTAVSPPILNLYEGFGVGGFGGWPGQPATNDSLDFDGTSGRMRLLGAAYLLMGGAGDLWIPLANIGSAPSDQMFHVLTLVSGLVDATPYRLGMVTVMGAFFNESPHSLMGTGVDNRTAGGAGTLVLVTPATVYLGALGTLGSVATLTLDFGPAIPEPGTLVLLGAGVAALAAGRRRAA